LGFVVLPKPKIDGAMYNSTYPTAKTREEQQQMWAKLLFYQSKKLIETHNLTIPKVFKCAILFGCYDQANPPLNK